MKSTKSKKAGKSVARPLGGDMNDFGNFDDVFNNKFK